MVPGSFFFAHLELHVVIGRQPQVLLKGTGLPGRPGGGGAGFMAGYLNRNVAVRQAGQWGNGPYTEATGLTTYPRFLQGGGYLLTSASPYAPLPFLAWPAGQFLKFLAFAMALPTLRTAHQCLSSLFSPRQTRTPQKFSSFVESTRPTKIYYQSSFFCLFHFVIFF